MCEGRVLESMVREIIDVKFLCVKLVYVKFLCVKLLL